MSTLSELREERLKKLVLLVERGIDPYPLSAKRDYELSEARALFSTLSKKKKPINLVGRVKAIRAHGGSIFIDLDDGTGTLQVYFKKETIGADQFTLLGDVIDLGDFIEVRGNLFITKKKEKSLLVLSWRMLSKSIRPLPDKWHGLSDVEERFRKRYLDLIANHEIRKRFVSRSVILREIRTILDKDGFIEVETPMLQSLPGGATAKPFATHHNALGIDLYLRIAPELYLKKLLIGGMNKIYELGRNFRNEGIDATHNPEFTSIEVYTAYASPEEERKKIERIIRSVVKKVSGKYSFVYQGKTILVPTHFKVITFSTLMKQYALIGERELSNREELTLKAKQFGITVSPHEGTERILDNIYKKVARPKLIEPTFVVEYPEAFSPLAKHHPEKKGFIDRFQLIVSGLELVNGFAELNNPVEQEKRFIEQEQKRKEGDEEAQIKDEEYIEAMEYGMPPATGWAIGIDRLVMFLTDTSNIREVVLFPTLKPKEE